MEKIIKTERLILREPKFEDRFEIFGILNNKEVNRYISGLYCEDLSDTEFLMEMPFDFKSEFCFVIENIITKKLVGIIYADISIGYILQTTYAIRKEDRGKGYMTEALKAFIKFIYKSKIASSVDFSIENSNERSLNIMKKLNISPIFKLPNFTIFNLSMKKGLPF